MFVNFIVVLLGINWFLGFFGLALKPLEDLDNTEESGQKFKEKKRKIEEICKFNGIDEDQQKLTKRPKPDEVLGQEKDTSETDDEELGINKKLVGSDKAKAIAEFQSRLWNMKPDMNFFNKEEHSEAEVMVPAKESDYDLVEECNVLKVEGDRKDVLKKVINPSESFDDVLNMSEETSDTPTGDEVVDIDEDMIDIVVEEDDVSLGDATSVDPVDAQCEQDEECRVEDQVETAATNIGLHLESAQHMTPNEDKVDFETKPTDENECNDETSHPSNQKIEENNTYEGQIYEEESFPNNINAGSVPTECDYPLLVKPDYAVQAKPDYPVQEKPDYALQEKPDYQVQHKPDYQVIEKPTYEVIEKPIYQVQEKPDYPVKEKLDYPIIEKPNYQAQEKSYCVVLDSMVEKQDDLHLATKKDDSVVEKLDQLTKNKPFLEEQMDEKSQGEMTQMRIAEEQPENDDAAPEDNEYETLEMESCENTIEFVEENAVTEAGQVYEKSEEIFVQLCTAEDQTVEENSVADDNEMSETSGVEVFEDTTSVEKEKAEAIKEEGRRGSVGAKGKCGGGNKSGSKQKKKKRKIL